MSTAFDPYHKWLGIPPKDQPPHHYRLLGIELFEQDVEVIEAAADRLMSYLHEVAAGDDTGLSQKLLNEIAAARLCLVNIERKTEYDAYLQAQIGDTSALAQSELEADEVEPPSSSTRSIRQHIAWGTAGLALLLVAVPIGILVIRTPSSPSSLPPTADDNSLAVEQAPPPMVTPQLVLDWPETEREGARLEVNGAAYEVPRTGSIHVPIVAGPLELRLARTDYIDVAWSAVVARGEIVRFSPVWEPRSIAQSPGDSAASLPAEWRTANALGPTNVPPHNDPSRSTPTAPATQPTASSDQIAKPSTQTWTKLPHAIPLPALSAAADTASPLPLLQLPNVEHLQVRLIGGESLVPFESFQMTQREAAGGQQWIVQHIDRQEKRTEIGHFVLHDQTLSFQWQPGITTPTADFLRNAALEIAESEHRHYVALRSATPIEPLLISGVKGTGKVNIRIQALPAVDKLRLELIASTGTQSFCKMLPDQSIAAEQPLSVDLGAAKLSFPLEVTLSFRAPRAGSGLLHVAYDVRYQSQSQPTTLTELSVSNVRRDLQILQQLAQIRGGNSPNLDQLQDTRDYYTQLSQIAAGQSQLQLRYRIVLPLGPTDVVLAQ